MLGLRGGDFVSRWSLGVDGFCSSSLEGNGGWGVVREAERVFRVTGQTQFVAVVLCERIKS